MTASSLIKTATYKGLNMSYESFELIQHQRVCQLKLNRPDQLNSMDLNFWREFPQAIKAISQDNSIRALVISSSGKHFCAGMDLAVFAQGIQDPDLELARKHENMRQLVLQLQDCFNALEALRIPVLAAVQGGCIGGALDLVAACDMRYCTDKAFFSIEEINIGMTADLGSLQRLPKLMPEGLVRELAYSGRRLAADQALQVGLVNKVYADQEQMETEVLALAQQIASRSPLAIAGCKQMLNYSRDHSLGDSLDYMATWQAGMFQQQDILASVTAKMQKTEPEYDDIASLDNKFYPIK